MKKIMPDPKPSYTDLVHQVVRQAPKPLPFVEIMRRVNAIARITTKNPEGTIRAAIGQSRLIVNTGNGLYGWKYRVITGSVMWLNLCKSDVKGSALELTEELRDALWPAFFEIQKRYEREPINLRLPNGQVTPIALDHFGRARWGTKGSPEFWDWFQAVKPQAGDAMIFRALDGEKRLYPVEFEPRSARDEAAIAARNQQIVQAALEYYRCTPSGAEIWDISSHLLATGQYQHPVPPDSLEKLWTRDLWEPELAKKPVRGGWVRGTRRCRFGDLKFVPANRGRCHAPQTAHETEEENCAESGTGRTESHLCRLKVTLQNSHPVIWRRVQVPGDLPLSRLHGVLQIVMGWTNSHMHQFKAGGHYYGTHEWGLEPKIEDERLVRLNQIAPRAKDRFIYEYDFGDSWEHGVVEKKMPRERNVDYPRCIAGERACPPEDVGGVWGYRDFLLVFRNPKHPEHAELVEWVGKKFDPNHFDLEGVNGMLKLYPAWRDEE